MATTKERLQEIARELDEHYSDLAALTHELSGIGIPSLTNDLRSAAKSVDYARDSVRYWERVEQWGGR